MNFQQLRIIREMVRRNFNLTEVGNALFTSQSGVSKHIRDLEDELGIELFIRKGKRVLGPTEPGKELAAIVERMLLDAGNIKNLADQYSKRDQGQLIVATTHTQARYSLPRVVAAFRQAFPKVHLVLHQASPGEIVTMLLEGRADIGIATEELAGIEGLSAFPYYTWHHAAIVPAGHALERARPLTLAALAGYPLVTYHEGFTGRAGIDAAFSGAGITPDIVMSALDADVIKTYVELGLGIGIIASMAFDPARDDGLSLLESGPLFPRHTTQIAVRCGHYLRGYAYCFIELCAPNLSEARVKEAVKTML
jgi:LysR family cys regulon transcriptional activator